MLFKTDLKDGVFGWTPLTLVAKNGHESIAKLLFNLKKVEANSRDVNNRTPISWAAMSQHGTIVELLLEHIN
jgi:ankyrin repeat protein